MTRKDEIKQAYRGLGGMHSFYDGMMTCSTLPGRLVSRAVWDMGREEALDYQAAAIAPIPADFSGKLLEVPVGTGVLTMPVYRGLPGADITCLDYSEKMMDSARQRAEALSVKNVTFRQGDVGNLPFPDASFDVVLSMNGFHAFPDKEAAYRETFRVLKPGGVFCGCFYVTGGCARTARMIRRFYVKAGFFTPPFETHASLEARLKGMYAQAVVEAHKAIACFRCVKGQ